MTSSKKNQKTHNEKEGTTPEFLKTPNQILDQYWKEEEKKKKVDDV